MEKIIIILIVLASIACNTGPVHLPYLVKSQVLDTNASGLPIWKVRQKEHSRDYTTYSISIHPWFGLNRRMMKWEHGSFDSFEANCIAKGDKLWLKDGADHLNHDHPLLLMDFNCDSVAVLDSAYDPSWQRKVYTRFLKKMVEGADTLYLFEWDGVVHHGYAHLGSHVIYFSKNNGFVGIVELCRDYNRIDTICSLGYTPGFSKQHGINCIPCRCAE
jgi:hypothetical protein